MATSASTDTQFDDSPSPAMLVGSDFAAFPANARDRSIPIRTGDLARLLMAEPGLSHEERASLAQFVRLVGSVFHYEYYAWLTELKELYAPIDPDSDCFHLNGHSRDAAEDSDEKFLAPFEAALIRANYRKLEFRVLEHAIATPNELGLNYIPDLDLFEHLRVYVRGSTQVSRSVRSFRTRFRRREVSFNGYRRLVVALKFRPSKKLDQYAKSDVLYLRMFKDVPYVDMEMHLPEQGTKVKMRLIDKAQIASPLVAFPATLAAKMIGAAVIGLSMPTIALGGLLAAPVTAGINSFFGFQRAKQRHLHFMIRHLYYLTLANNSSVINRLVDSAEEEDFKEALLAYFFLWHHRGDPEPWDAARLDARIEEYLRSQTTADIDFEIGDALAKLIRLGLVQSDPQGRLIAAPVDRALEILDGQWDNYFQFTPAAPQPGISNNNSTDHRI